MTAFAAVSLSAQTQPAENWTSVRTRNFAITGNAPVEQLTAAADRLEQFRWAFASLYPELKLDNGRPTKIVVFRDVTSYFGYLPKRLDGTADVGVAGYYQSGEDVNYITLALEQRRADPFSTAVHEYVHSLVDANFDRSSLPPWLSEGLSEYFETLRIENGRTVIVGTEHGEHLRMLKRLGLIAPAEFFAVTAADLKTMPLDRRSAYYAQSWAVVHWLIQNGKLSLRDLTKLAEKLKTSAGFESTFAIAYAELTKGLEQNIAGGPSRSVSIGPALAYVGDEPTIEPVHNAAVQALLGDLLLHTGEITKAEEILRASLAVDERSAAANASLGLLLLRRHRPGEAVVYLEKAMALGSENHLVYFRYAFALMREHAKAGGISQLSDRTAGAIRTALKRAIDLQPGFAESYRMLALVNFIRDENLDEAVAMLQKGLSLKPGAEDMKVLLARIMLRREDPSTAHKLAREVADSSTDLNSRADAEEIVKASQEVVRSRAMVTVPVQLTISLAEKQSLVILKRSWLTADEVKQVEDERINNNFNRIIIRHRVGEQSVVGSIARISCASNGTIKYHVRTNDGKSLELTSADFSSVRMTVAREGESTFQIGCGVSLEKDVAVFNYRPSPLPGARTAGELTAISFVPENFRYKSTVEMNSARMVSIEDDTLRRSGGPSPVTTDSILNSIQQNIRRPQHDETRIAGSIENIECPSAGKMVFHVTASGRTYRLSVDSPDKTHVAWYTVASTQLPLSCGNGPFKMNTLLTFRASAEGMNGDLRAVEFVPEGFVP